MTYTVRLDELRKDDIALAGGKGANLGELSHAGLPTEVLKKAYESRYLPR